MSQCTPSITIIKRKEGRKDGGRKGGKEGRKERKENQLLSLERDCRLGYFRLLPLCFMFQDRTFVPYNIWESHKIT
jgi:hypothetical protein